MEVPYSSTIIGGLPWYSVLVVSGIMLAIWLAGKEEKRLALPKDTAIDLALLVVPFGILGARLYYVLMRWEQFAHQPVSILYVWRGGLGIYGGVIGGAAAALFYAYKKKLSFAALADMIAPGLILAQAIGRWGNYFNMEAYGVQLSDVRLHFFPMAVWIPTENAWHAATFFYESMWNLLGFFALWKLRTAQHEQGNVFAWYLLIYGAGRFIIEQIRADSLYIGHLRVSQWLSLCLCLSVAGLLIYRAKSERSAEVWLAEGCACVLFMRWAALNSNAAYIVLLMLTGILGLWVSRNNRKAIVCFLGALLLDGAGVAVAIANWPFEMASYGIHVALCTLTLPINIWALCVRS